MASKYHPDKLTGVSEDIKKLAQEKFLAVKEAYEQIMKRKKSGQQNYNLTPFYMITPSFQTKNCSVFCTDNQSTNTSLKN